MRLILRNSKGNIRGISALEILIILCGISLLITTIVPIPDKALASTQQVRQQTVIANIELAKVRFSNDFDRRVLDFYAKHDNDVAYSLLSPYISIDGVANPTMRALLVGSGKTECIINTFGYPVVLR